MVAQAFPVKNIEIDPYRDADLEDEIEA